MDTPCNRFDPTLTGWNDYFDSSPDLIAILDSDHRIVRINNAMAELLGCTPEEAVGRPCYQLVHHTCAAPSFCPALQLYDDHAPHSAELFLEGPGIWVQVNLTPFFHADGSLAGAIHLGRNITTRKLAEQKLLDSSRHMENILNSIEDGICILDREYNILDMNRAMEKLYGGLHSFADRKCYRAFHSREDICPWCPVEIVYAKGEKHSIVVPHPDGENPRYWFQVQVTPLVDQQGVITGVVEQFKDITELKEVEELLLKSRDLYKTVIDTVPSILYIATPPRFTIDYVSSSLTRLLGYTRADLLEDPEARKRLIHEEDFEQVAEELAIALSSGADNFEVEYRVWQKERNRFFWFVDHGKIKRDAQGKPIQIFGVMLDITERKQVQEEVRAGEELFKVFFNSVNDAIFVHPPKEEGTDHFIEVNDIACSRYGYSKEEFLRLSPSDISIQDKVTKQTAPQFRQKLLDEGHTLFEAIHVNKSGSTFPVEVSANMVELAGRPVIMSVVRDLTDKKQLERELIQAQKMEAIGTLAGGIAHDFNNILSVTIGFSELIKQQVPPDSTISRDIDEVLQSGKRAADLVKQILTFSRHVDGEKHPLYPHLVIKESLKLLRATMPSTVEIREEIDPECAMILANPAQIQQIVVNLCTNALHAMVDEKGVLSVSLQSQPVDANDCLEQTDCPAGLYAVLTVSDTGCGMDKPTVDRIFEPYFTTKEQGKGSGLGLAIIHGIVKSSGGFIKVESSPGKGSTFKVFLPALVEEAVEPLPSEHDLPMDEGDHHILLVDDEPLLVRVTQRQFENQGYTVTGTADSREALALFRADPARYDILVTDQTMPGLTGIELAQAVMEIRPDMPVILCTGHSNLVSREGSLALGIKRYVHKPIVHNELLTALQAVLAEAAEQNS